MSTQPTSPHINTASDRAAGPPSAGSVEPSAAARPDVGSGGTPDVDELTRLRTEVSALHARLDTRHRRASAVRTLRRATAAVLIAITAFALVTSVVGVWSARTALNTDRWVATVAPLPQDPQVAAAVADYATNQVFLAIDVEQRLRAVLPPQAAFITGPVAGQLRDATRKTVTNVLQSDQFQRIWVELTRRAHQRAVAIIEGSSDVALVRQDRVDIDLLPLINQVLRQLSSELPTMFGKQISLPDLSSGAIPENLRTQVEQTLGVTLPPNFAQFTVYDSGQLWAAQQAVATAKRGLVLFVLATILLLLIAVAVSPVRRRTLLQLGLWLVVAAVAVTAALRAVRTEILQQVPDGIYRDGVAATMTIVFAQLRTRGVQLIWIGVVLAAVMYLVGPGRGPRWLRRQIAAGARAFGRLARTGAHTVATHGPGFTARYLDVIRVSGLIVAAVFALVLSSWTALLVIALVLAGFEILVTVVGRSGARSAGPPDGDRDAAAASAGAG